MKYFAIACAIALIAASVVRADLGPRRPVDAHGNAVPPENAERFGQPPALPPPGDTDARARLLFEAIVRDEPERAMPFFFPREPFLRVKAIANPGGYWETLRRAYERDIHTLHAQLGDLRGREPARIEFVRLEFSRRKTWQAVRSEANAIPYWCVRHNQLVYLKNGREQRIEVRTLIHWGANWFVTHLI